MNNRLCNGWLETVLWKPGAGMLREPAGTDANDTPVAKRFGTRVDVRGIADVSAVPRLLRGTVRAAFRKEQTHPVMLDWLGRKVKQFAPKENVTTVLLIDGRGKSLRRFEGAAQAADTRELCLVIEKLLPPQETKVAAKP